MNILVSGILGYMGREVVKLCVNGCRGAVCVGGVDPNCDGSEKLPVFKSFEDVSGLDIDCVIDFSHHSATPALLDLSVKENLPVILCTTGHTEEELEIIRNASKEIPVFLAANMSVGVSLLVELAKITAKIISKVIIISPFYMF